MKHLRRFKNGLTIIEATKFCYFDAKKIIDSLMLTDFPNATQSILCFTINRVPIEAKFSTATKKFLYFKLPTIDNIKILDGDWIVKDTAKRYHILKSDRFNKTYTIIKNK